MKIRRDDVATVGVCITLVLTLVFGVIAYNIPMPMLFILSPAILYIIFVFILFNFFEDSDTTLGFMHESNFAEIERNMREITRLNGILMRLEMRKELLDVWNEETKKPNAKPTKFNVDY